MDKEKIIEELKKELKYWKRLALIYMVLFWINALIDVANNYNMDLIFRKILKF